MTAVHTIWQTLGDADHHGFAQVDGHAHCTPTLSALIIKFLLNQSGGANAFQKNIQFKGSWIDWTAPTLGN
jgi:hypothetical protein